MSVRACRPAWDVTGTMYAGAPPATVAAADPEAGSAVRVRPLVSWWQRIADGTGADGVDVLAVDEAAVTDDRQMSMVRTEATRTGTKVVAIGDPLPSGDNRRRLRRRGCRRRLRRIAVALPPCQQRRHLDGKPTGRGTRAGTRGA